VIILVLITTRIVAKHTDTCFTIAESLNCCKYRLQVVNVNEMDTLNRRFLA